MYYKTTRIRFSIADDTFSIPQLLVKNKIRKTPRQRNEEGCRWKKRLPTPNNATMQKIMQE